LVLVFVPKSQFDPHIFISHNWVHNSKAWSK